MFVSASTKALQSSFSTSSFPSLPGIKAAPQSNKNSHAKHQRFKVSRDGNRVESEMRHSRQLRHSLNHSEEDIYNRKVKLLQEWDSLEQEASLRASASGVSLAPTMRSSMSTSSLRVPPRWLENDREVLRFYMYFKEAVHESRMETYRVRKCILLFFLTDNTIRIEEPKENNSGLPQGVFLNRGFLKKPDGSDYAPEDFMVGQENLIHGRKFRVVNMDPKTKTFFEDRGIAVPRAEGYPTNPYDDYVATSKQRFSVDSIVGSKAPDTLGQYLKNDRKVLRFHLLWDDTEMLYGKRNEYVLCYYLTNDEIEIRNVIKSNAGEEPFPTMLNRRRLPKSGSPEDDSKGFYRPEDLICGKYMNVYTRQMLIRKCDEETKEWYRNEHGIEQVDQRIRDPPVPVVTQTVPPYNGFGSEEDSLANCLNLISKPVKQDLYRFLTNRGKVLRFRAKFVTPGPEDVDRRFVITYFMDDDTIAVYEPPQRNSGIVGGKFLERGRYKKRSKNNKKAEKATALQNLLYEKINSRMTGGPYGLLRAFRKFGTDDGGGIDVNSFKVGLRSVGFIPQTVSDDEIEELFYQYDTTRDGRIDYQEFVDHVMQDKPMDHRENTKARWFRAGDFFIGAKVDFVFLSGNKTQEFEIYGADDFTIKLMEENPEDFPKSNIEMISSQLATTLAEYGIKVRAIFRNIDKAGNGYITTQQFVTLLRKWATDFKFVEDELTDQEAMTLVRAYDRDGDGKIMYAEFCDALLSKNRPRESRAIHVDTDKVDKAFTLVMEKLAALKEHKDLRKTFLDLDTDRSGRITYDELLNILFRYEIELNENESACFFANFDKNQDGYISFHEFCDALYDQPAAYESKYADEMPESKMSAPLNKPPRTPMMKDYKQKLLDVQRQANQEHDLKLCMKAFTSNFFSRKVTLRKHFLNFDLDQSGTICKDEFEEALTRTNNDFSQHWKQVLLHYFFPDDDHMLSYDRFMEMMFKQDINASLNAYGSLNPKHVDTIRFS